jgi:molecular chaperone DnaK
MGKVAVDFGTSNTVIARLNETENHVETVEIPGITSQWRYRLRQEDSPHVVHGIPSLIHYGETRTLIGQQVVDEGLADHKDTMRWMKQAISTRNMNSKVTSQGRKTYRDAGEDFLRTALNYVGNTISLADDEFTFTAPVEAFEDFQDWLWTVAESTGIRRLRMLDEPTACIFGYDGQVSGDARFAVLDCGGGTLDVSCVRIDMDGHSDRKAIQLGKSGDHLGGMNVDKWIADDFCARHDLPPAKRRELEGFILRAAEATKIALSDPKTQDTDMTVTDTLGPVVRSYTTTYLCECAACHDGVPGRYDKPDESCLGCILLGRNFIGDVAKTVDRAIENAAIEAGMRRDELTRVLVTGGTSLMPCIRRYLKQTFDGRLHRDHPFDSVARGACRGVVIPVLQHDYALESYNPDSGEYEFRALFPLGTEYPTKDEDVKRRGVGGAFDGQTEIELLLFEVSRMVRRDVSVSIVDDQGRFHDKSQVATGQEFICLNRNNPTCIPAGPPVNIARDDQIKRNGTPVRRFGCVFSIDENRRLLVDVIDRFTGREIYRKHPVVRL